DQHVHQIARREVQVLVDFLGDDQNRFEVHGLEPGGQLLGLGRVHLHGVDHGEAPFARQLGEDGRHAGAVHLLVDLLGEVLVRAVRENPAASAPQRRRGHTGTGTARSLLLERLLGRVMDLLAVLLGPRALAGIGLEGDDDLVHQVFVVFTAEHGFGRVVLRRGLALLVQEFELHYFAPFSAVGLAFTAGRTVTKPPLEPGTAPLISSSWRASSIRMTSRFWVVTVSSPRWPVMRLPGNTRPGSCAMPMEPGTLCERLLPCDARCDFMWWRLIVPAKPLPIVVPCTSTFWPTAKTSAAGTVAPAAYLAAASWVTRNSAVISP